MTQTDVLVVGAGPTGLTLACDLAGVASQCVSSIGHKSFRAAAAVPSGLVGGQRAKAIHALQIREA